MKLDENAINEFRERYDELLKLQKYKEINELVTTLEINNPDQREMLTHHIITFCDNFNPITVLKNFYVLKLSHYSDRDIRLLKVLATLYKKLNLYDLALSITEKMVILGDTSEVQLAIRAYCLHQLDRTEEVIHLALKELPDHSEFFDLRFYLLASYLRKGEIVKAHKELDILVKMNPAEMEQVQEHMKDWTPDKYLKHQQRFHAEARALFPEAQKLVESGDTLRAAGLFSQIIHFNPKFTPGLISYGKLLHEWGFVEESLSLYQRALDITPYSPSVNFSFALHQYSSGRLQETINYCQKTIEYNPEFHQAYTVLGDIYCDHINDQEAAIRYFKKSLEIYPNEAVVWTRLGYSLRALSNLKDAEAAFKKALIIDASSNAAIALADLYRSGGKHSEAVKLLENYLKNEPNCIDAMAQLGEMYAETSEEESLNGLIARAKFYEETKTDDFYWKGRLLQLRDRVEAIKCFERYLVIAEKHTYPPYYVEGAKSRLQTLKGGLN